MIKFEKYESDILNDEEVNEIQEYVNLYYQTMLENAKKNKLIKNDKDNLRDKLKDKMRNEMVREIVNTREVITDEVTIDVEGKLMNTSITKYNNQEVIKRIEKKYEPKMKELEEKVE